MNALVPSSPFNQAAADVALALASGGNAASTAKSYAGALRQVLTWCDARGLPSEGLTDQLLAECLASASRGGVPGFARRCGPSRLRVVACAVRAAYASRGLADPWGPACVALYRTVERNAPAPKLGYVLKPDQVRALVRWALRPTSPVQWWVAPVVVVGWCAALRAGELRDAGRLVQPGILEVRGKGGSRRIPLSRGPARDLCPVVASSILHARGFAASTRVIATHLGRAFEALGYEGCTPHSLRRGWATAAALAGMPLNIVSDALGHADLRTVIRYARAPCGPLPALL